MRYLTDDRGMLHGMGRQKTNKDLREMLSAALGMIETMLPRVNESYVLSHALRLTISEMNPVAGKRLEDKLRKSMNSSIDLVAEPLAIMQDYQRYLDDDSLWKD